jgi:hypothetical protein
LKFGVEFDVTFAIVLYLVYTVTTGVSFRHLFGTETVPRKVSFQHLKVSVSVRKTTTCKFENDTFKCENDTLFILSSIGNDTFKCLI